MRLSLKISNVQHIASLELELNLDANKLTCIVGKNGVGKTTLVRALRNLSHSDTFLRTAPRDIFSKGSAISYRLDEEFVTFSYDEEFKSLNCRDVIPESARNLCSAELAMPHGDRFHFFQSVSDADQEIRSRIVLEEYSKPVELIAFLSDIYSSNKFESLVEIAIRGRSYFCILKEDSRYLREDYFSSGEYFLISLYRTIRGSARLIAVDEIDLSLDPAAQVHLIRKLREFCVRYSCNILFTTHSLAMMRTLNASELFYMESQDGVVSVFLASYSYIKTLLFGFSGWDKYILTEDEVLQEYLESLIQRSCGQAFYRHKIIHVGGGTQVVGLMRRNESEEFLATAANVIAILDGDQRASPHSRVAGVHLLPFDSVEKALAIHYEEDDFPRRLGPGKQFNGAKDLFHSLQRDQVMSRGQIYAYLSTRNEDALRQLVDVLNRFLSRP